MPGGCWRACRHRRPRAGPVATDPRARPSARRPHDVPGRMATRARCVDAAARRRDSRAGPRRRWPPKARSKPGSASCATSCDGGLARSGEADVQDKVPEPQVEYCAAGPVHDERQKDDGQDYDDHPEEEHDDAGDGIPGYSSRSSHGHQLPTAARLIRQVLGKASHRLLAFRLRHPAPVDNRARNADSPQEGQAPPAGFRYHDPARRRSR